MHLHVVRPTDGWILQQIGESFPGTSVSDRADPNADANFYVNYHMMKRSSKSFDVPYFTHRGRAQSWAKRFDEVARMADLCLAMCAITARWLPKEKTKLFVPPIPDQYFGKPLVLGVCSRADHARKRIHLVKKLRTICEVRFTGGKIKDIRQWYSGIDYLVVLSDLEGGPMPVLEAMQLRIPVIAPNVGWCWDYPVIRYGSDQELFGIVERLAHPAPTRVQATAHLFKLISEAMP